MGLSQLSLNPAFQQNLAVNNSKSAWVLMVSEQFLCHTLKARLGWYKLAKRYSILSSAKVKCASARVLELDFLCQS